MIKARKRTLYLILMVAVFLSVLAALVLYALSQNISLFYSPTQISKGEPPLQKNIRVGGMVQEGSVIRNNQGLQVQFDITDFEQSITIHYEGILPDLFREGQGIVAEGILLDPKNFKASQVLAKHDANYMPPEVKSTLSLKNAPYNMDKKSLTQKVSS